MLKEFKEFALRGSVIDLAVGVMVGGALNKIVNSLVSDILMPPIGLLLGDMDFGNIFILLKEGTPVGPYGTLDAAQKAGAVTVNLGVFINSIISFLIIAFVLFIMIRGINRLRREDVAVPAAPAIRECPYCRTEIPLAATRCPHCTSELPKED